MFDVDILHTPSAFARALVPAQAGATSGVDVTRYLLACLVVVGLLCIGAWFLSRLGRGSLVGRAKKRSLQMVDVLPLGRRQRLCVARVYDRTFVLGVGEREVALVAELDSDDDRAAQALLESGQQPANTSRPGSFAALLKGALGGGAGGGAAAAVAANARAARSTAEPQPQPRPEPESVSSDDVETRAARAAREALLAILDERRESAPSAAPARTTTTERRPVQRAARSARTAGAKAAAARDAGSSSAPRRTARPKKGAATAATKPAAERRAVAERPAAATAERASAAERPTDGASERSVDTSSTWVG